MNYELKYLCGCFSTVPFKAPTNLTGMATNSTSVLVKWDPLYLPTIRGILRGYTVYYKEDSSSVHPSILRNVSVAMSVTNAQLVNLHKYTYYHIWVTAFTTRQGLQSSPLFVQTHEDSKYKYFFDFAVTFGEGKGVTPLNTKACAHNIIQSEIVSPSCSHTQKRARKEGKK